MALDGAFLRHTAKEIEQAALGARVDKIYQPNREENYRFSPFQRRRGAFAAVCSRKQCAYPYHRTCA